VVFYYDIFRDARANLERHGLRLHSLATWWDVLQYCRNEDYFDNATLNEVEAFLNSPLEWSAARGGAGEISSG